MAKKDKASEAAQDGPQTLEPGEAIVEGAEEDEAAARAAAPAPAVVRVKMPDDCGGACYQGVALRLVEGVIECEHRIAAHLVEAFGGRVLPPGE